MALFDQITGKQPISESTRAGLLNMGIGLLAGSTGNYGAFAPAMAMGLQGFQQGQQQHLENQMRQQQLKQQAMAQEAAARLRGLQTMQLERDILQQEQANQFFGGASAAQPLVSGGDAAQALPVNDGSEVDLMAQIEAGLIHPNPEVRKWATQQARIHSERFGGASAPIPTAQGYGRVVNGKFEILRDESGAPYMPVSALSNDPNVQRSIAEARAYGQTSGQGQAEREAAMPTELAQIEMMENTVERILNHPALPYAVGWQANLPVVAGSPQADFRTAAEQLEGQAFLQAFESLKGGGQITEIEGQKATQAIANLSVKQSDEQYIKSLQDLREVLAAARERIRKQAGASGYQPSSSDSPSQSQGQPQSQSQQQGGGMNEYFPGF